MAYPLEDPEGSITIITPEAPPKIDSHALLLNDSLKITLDKTNMANGATKKHDTETDRGNIASDR